MNQKNLHYDIHKAIIVCDAHCDTVDRLIKDKTDLGIRSKNGHIDIPRLIEGGVDVQVFASYVGGPKKPKGYYFNLAKRKINILRTQFAKNSKSISLALKISDIQKARDKKISAILAVEGGQSIENDINNLRIFYDLGVRIMTLTWKSTDWADASQQPIRHNGLTDLGKTVVKEMNKLKMIIDVSHSADKTVLDVLKVSNDPIIASHSCAKALCDHPRNLNDKLIKDIANAGGVICVNFYPLFLDQKFKTDTEKNLKPKLPSYMKIIDHIDHIVQIGGINCVGLGSDFDGIDSVPNGLEDVTKMPRITSALLERGYLQEEVSQIMGGNFLRIFGQVCGI
ncbi:MAG: dipeptidase [Candidatus Poribacteria bacterium]